MKTSVMRVSGANLYFAGHDINGSFRLTPYPYGSNAIGYSGGIYADQIARILNTMYPGLNFVPEELASL